MDLAPVTRQDMKFLYWKNTVLSRKARSIVPAVATPFMIFLDCVVFAEKWPFVDGQQRSVVILGSRNPFFTAQESLVLRVDG